MAPAAHPDAFVYSTRFIDTWLHKWDEVKSLAESYRTSAHFLRHEKGCSCEAKPAMVGGKRVRGVRCDTLSYADLKVDLETAFAALGIGNMERMTVFAVAHRVPLDTLVDLKRCRRGLVYAAYKRALQMMADRLNGGHVAEESEQPEVPLGAVQLVVTGAS